MNSARPRRALRASVFVASAAVLASFLVAPVASAEEGPAVAPTTAAEETSTPDAEPTPEPTAPATDTPATAGPDATATPEPTPTPPPATGDAGTVDAGDTVVGELVQAWPDPVAEEVLGHDEHDHSDEHDHADEHTADEVPLTWIQPTEGDAVRVPTEDVPSAPVGSTVAVTVGEEVTDEASAEQGFDEAREVLDAQVLQAAAPDPTTAAAGAAPTNTVTVVLVVPAGGTADSTTVTSVVDELDNGVAGFWASQSNDTIRLDAVAGAAGWITSSRACSDPTGLWNDAAARVGWTGGPGKHLMLYLPRTSTSCSYGLGTVGSSSGSGGVSYVRDVATSVMAHELGHNFGLGHSSAYQCDGAIEGGTCQTRAYYDLYDVMGISWGQVGSLNAAQSARLGLLPAAQRVAFTPGSPASTVTLMPASAASGTRAVQLTASNGTVYWLEYRQAAGRDAWLGDSRNAYGLNTGVVLRRAAGGSDTSLLLDGSPTRASGWSGDLQTALPVGAAVSVAGGEFTIEVKTTVGASATVAVFGVVDGIRGDSRCAGAQQVVSSGVALATQGMTTTAFGVGADSALWARSIGGTNSWVSLGGHVLYGPASVSAADGSVSVFAIGGDRALYTRVLTSGTWSDWMNLGGAASSSPAVALNSAGRLQVFVRGADNGLWGRSRVNGVWRDWQDLGGQLTSGPAAASVGAGVMATARGADGRMWTRTFSSDGVPNPYAGGVMAVCSAVGLVAVQPQAGGTSAVFTGQGGQPWAVDQERATPLSGNITSTPAIVSKDGATTVAARGADGALWVHTTGGGWRSLGGSLL